MRADNGLRQPPRFEHGASVANLLVLGCGVIGVTLAYYLAKSGHAVTVVDRQLGPGLETSYANAGEVSPGYSAPWAAPGIPIKAIKWAFMRHRPLVIWPKIDPAMWLWGLAMLRNCTAARYEINKNRMVRLAEYSRDCLQALRADTGIRYDERSLGTLQLFRTDQQLEGTAKDVAVLEQSGVPYELLDRDGCVRAEPALAFVKEKVAGGLRLPGDETGDCFKFTQALAKLAQSLGVTFRFGTTIHRLAREGNRLTGAETSAGPLQADAYVLALGSYSPRLAGPLGIR